MEESIKRPGKYDKLNVVLLDPWKLAVTYLILDQSARICTMFFSTTLEFLAYRQHRRILLNHIFEICLYWGREVGSARVGWMDGEKRHITVIEQQ